MGELEGMTWTIRNSPRGGLDLEGGPTYWSGMEVAPASLLRDARAECDRLRQVEHDLLDTREWLVGERERLRAERDEARAEVERLRGELEGERRDLQRLERRSDEAEDERDAALTAGRELADAVEEAHRCLTLIGHAGKKWADKAIAADEVLMPALTRYREATER